LNLDDFFQNHINLNCKQDEEVNKLIVLIDQN